MHKGLSKAYEGLTRRELLVMAGAAAGTVATYGEGARAALGPGNITVEEVGQGEDVFAYITRV